MAFIAFSHDEIVSKSQNLDPPGQGISLDRPFLHPGQLRLGPFAGKLIPIGVIGDPSEPVRQELHHDQVQNPVSDEFQDLVILTAVLGRIGPPHKGLLQQVGIAETVADLPLHIGNICVVHVHNPFSI